MQSADYNCKCNNRDETEKFAIKTPKSTTFSLAQNLQLNTTVTGEIVAPVEFSLSKTSDSYSRPKDNNTRCEATTMGYGLDYCTHTAGTVTVYYKTGASGASTKVCNAYGEVSNIKLSVAAAGALLTVPSTAQIITKTGSISPGWKKQFSDVGLKLISVGNKRPAYVYAGTKKCMYYIRDVEVGISSSLDKNLAFTAGKKLESIYTGRAKSANGTITFSASGPPETGPTVTAAGNATQDGGFLGRFAFRSVSGGGGKELPINVTPTIVSHGAPKDMVLSGAVSNGQWDYCETVGGGGEEGGTGTIKTGRVTSVTTSGQITISFELQKQQQ